MPLTGQLGIKWLAPLGFTSVHVFFTTPLVLLFGDAWYKNCPGVIRVNNINEARNAIRDIFNKKITADPKQLEFFLETLKKIGFRGIADYPPTDFPLNSQENIENLFKIICKYT